MSYDPGCVFCKIVRGEAPCFKVYEDEHVLSFMDIQPVSEGHTLVIPREHFENIFEMTEEAQLAVATVSRRVAVAVRATLAPDGIGLHQLNGKAAGQTVFHHHVHVMPRSFGEPLVLHRRERGDPARLRELAAALAAALDAQS